MRFGLQYIFRDMLTKTHEYNKMGTEVKCQGDLSVIHGNHKKTGNLQSSGLHNVFNKDGMPLLVKRSKTTCMRLIILFTSEYMLESFNTKKTHDHTLKNSFEAN